MAQIKIFVKQILTWIIHPVVSTRLLISGARNFSIKPQMTINKMKYLKVGNDVHIGRNSRFLFVEEYYGGHYNPGLRIGNHVSIGNRFSALSGANIEIEDDCLIASDVLITSENHGMNPELAASYAKIPLNVAEVKIGKGCWLGEKVSIMPGVVLGARCIVAANSVVTKSFPEACLVGGIPAKIIKRYNYETHQWEKQ